jgi:hypothetical protein
MSRKKEVLKQKLRTKRMREELGKESKEGRGYVDGRRTESFSCTGRADGHTDRQAGRYTGGWMKGQTIQINRWAERR